MAEIVDNTKTNPETVTEQPTEIDKDHDNNQNKSSTITSKDQLICKSSPDSHNNCTNTIKTKNCDKKFNDYDNYLIYTGLFQILFGVLMITFGILTIINKASLSQLGGGVWGGSLATINGIIGVLASARDCCPLKPTVQRIAHTIYLALSLICLATSQLIVAISAIGLGRDFNNLIYTMMEEAIDQDDDAVNSSIFTTTTTTQAPLSSSGTIYITLPVNYPILLYNIGLVVVSSLECLIATITSYKSSKLLCPCFQQRYNRNGTRTTQDDNIYRQAFVNNWLGKHSSSPQLFVVAATAPPSSLNKKNKLEVPILTLPVPPPPSVTAVPQLMTYPLIPAPLGTIPPPPPPSKLDMFHHQRRYFARLHAEQYYRRGSKSDISNSSGKSRSKSKNTNDNNNNSNKNDKLSDMDVAKTYTGLDKTIAEEFIDICDSRHNSMCGDSSCTSSTNSSSSNTTNSDLSSGDYLVNTKI